MSSFQGVSEAMTRNFHEKLVAFATKRSQAFLRGAHPA